jgi:hypothetical protein
LILYWKSGGLNLYTVDHGRPQSIVDRSNGAAAGSLELMLGAAPVSGCTPQVGEKGDELRGSSLTTSMVGVEVESSRWRASMVAAKFIRRVAIRGTERRS